MKNFDEIVDELFKPNFILKKKYHWKKGCHVESGKYKRAREEIQRRYLASLKVVKPCYGDINEPITKICRLMLDNPSRFVLVEEGVWEMLRMDARGYHTIREFYPKVIQDKVTQQKFVFNEQGGVEMPSFLTEDESELLFEVSEEWYIHSKNIIKENKLKQEQKRKEKHRQELVELYKED